MSAGGWRARSTVDLACEKAPASGGRGVAVTNHPLGTAAALEVLAEGGNAIDAAIAALFTLTVVEPMMVGIAGGGISHVRLADGRHVVIDAMSEAPGATHARIFEPVSDEPSRRMETVGRRSAIGPTAVAVPGNLSGWALMHRRFGSLPFADLVEPAIRRARRGFQVTHYLAGAIGEHGADLAADPMMASVFLAGGAPLAHGDRLVQPHYAESLELIARDGTSALYGGPLGDALVASMAGRERDATGWLARADLTGYAAVEREPIVGDYRGFQIVGPPPPASSGVHIVQMLNIIEGFDVRALGFGSPDMLDLLARVIAIGAEDRARYSGDPRFVDVPVERLISKAYAKEQRERITLGGAGAFSAQTAEQPHTTHVTIADDKGNLVSATHTINGVFGARYMVAGAGFIPNNYMMNFDPHPGRALSVAPGKRVPTSMAPMMVLADGAPRYALGLPGGVRIYPSAFQAILNLIDHGMSLQEAVEAPRLWTNGSEVEIERGYRRGAANLAERGHEATVVPHIGGGMNVIALQPDGTMTGAACWRADGTVAALGGGLARPGVRFWPNKAPEPPEAETASPKPNAG